MVLLSDIEQREMKEDAASAARREDFRHVEEASARLAQQVDLATYLSFLTFMSRLDPAPHPRPRSSEFSRVLL